VTLGERLREILSLLPEDWSEVRLVLTVADDRQADRAAMILAPLAPGRSANTFRLTVAPGGVGAPSVDAAQRVLDRLEQEGIDGRLSLPGTAAFQLSPHVDQGPRTALAAAWDEIAAALPADWAELQLEVEIASSDDVDRAALALGPLNPFLHDGVPPAFRFRAARRFGYGAAPEVVRRMLARLDEQAISGVLRVLRVQSSTAPVLTQGSVWREGGRAV
jgi:hypothetical protein